jgi:hypothetical protein
MNNKRKMKKKKRKKEKKTQNSPVSASLVVETIGMCHNARLKTNDSCSKEFSLFNIHKFVNCASLS